MMTDAPCVSIVTPAYNAAAYIGATIRSVFDQTFTNWELIVADDGSTDETCAVVEGFADPRIRLVRREHAGLPAVARNAAIAQARGEYIAFLDADDIWMPEKLDLQVRCFQAQAEVGLVFSQFYYWYEAYGRLRKRAAPDLRGLPNPGVLTVQLCIDNLICNSSAVVRRRLIDECGGMDEDPRQRGTEDYALWLRLAPHTLFGWIDRPLVWYRVRTVSTSSRWMPIVEGRFLALEKMLRCHPELRRDPRLSGVRVSAHRLLWFGIAAMLDGDARAGRSHLLRSLRIRPQNRTAWAWFGLSCLGWRTVLRLRRLTHRFL